MLNTQFSPWPSYTHDEEMAVQKVLRSNRVNYWTGEECRKFEAEFCDWSGAQFAIALGNGTLALDLALMALGVGTGDEVVVTPRTFIASVSCVVTAGAKPIFADVDENSGNITAETILRVLTPRTKAIICVHLAGWPCDMDPIIALAEKYNLKIIEDCAQAHGARYKGRSVGCIGHVGAWSFCQDKIISTGGEGGMVTTNDKSLWNKMWSYKDHGKSYQAVFEKNHPPGFRWVHDSFGTNWRMMEMQAAIGRIQLGQMSSWTEIRNRNANAIARALAPFSGNNGIVHIPDFNCSKCCINDPSQNACPLGCVHAQYKFYVYVQQENLAFGWNRDRIVEIINEMGVPCYQGTCSEVYLEKAFDQTDLRPELRLPIAQKLGETSIMFLVHPTLTMDEIDKTCSVIDHAFRNVVNKAPASTV